MCLPQILLITFHNKTRERNPIGKETSQGDNWEHYNLSKKQKVGYLCTLLTELDFREAFQFYSLLFSLFLEAENGKRCQDLSAFVNAMEVISSCPRFIPQCMPLPMALIKRMQSISKYFIDFNQDKIIWVNGLTNEWIGKHNLLPNAMVF